MSMKNKENVINELLDRINNLNEESDALDKALNELCTCYEHAGEYDSAIPVYEKLIRIRRKKFGNDHEMTAHSVNNMAGLYVQKGEFKEAVRYMATALDIYIKTLGKDHETTEIAAKNMLFLESVINKDDDDKIII